MMRLRQSPCPTKGTTRGLMPPARRSLNLQFAFCILQFAILLLSAAPAHAIDFLTTPAAIPANDLRPRVMVFGATWCGWCRKLAGETLMSPVVSDREKQFAWLKIDVDEHDQLAARYGVTGLPHTIITDAQGNVIGEKSGYLPAVEFAAFLDATLKNPQSTASDLSKWLGDLKSSDVAVRRETVRKLIQHVSRVDSPGRDQTIAALKGEGPAAWSEVAPYLGHPRLAIRAAAAGLLQRATLANRDFDPFAAAEVRTAQSAEWTKWVESQGGAVPTISFVDPDADASAWSLEGNADRPPAPPLAQPLETPAIP
jgi:thioredoxin-related protein